MRLSLIRDAPSPLHLKDPQMVNSSIGCVLPKHIHGESELDTDSADSEVVQSLAEHLPEGQRTQQHLEKLITSAQLRHQLDIFSSALRSGQLDLAHFGLQGQVCMRSACFKCQTLLPLHESGMTLFCYLYSMQDLQHKFFCHDDWINVWENPAGS